MKEIYRIKIIVTNGEGKEETIYFPELYEKGDNITCKITVGESLIITSEKGK